MAFSQNCGKKMVPIMAMPEITAHRNAMTMFALVKYFRLRIGSAARRSRSTNSGRSTTNATRNGHTSVDAIDVVKSKKSMFLSPYMRLSVMSVRMRMPRPSRGPVFSACAFGRRLTPRTSTMMQMGMFT